MQETGLEKIRNFGVAMFEFDFALHGGAVGTITVANDVIPDDAVIQDGFIEIKTAVTSGGGATIALHINASEDILAATGKASFSAGALLDPVCDGTAANMIKTAAKQNLSVVVAVADLTAGKFWVVVRYIVTN